MTRRDLITLLMNTELDEHRNLTRQQARVVVDEVFGAIKDALRNGEDAHLPFGSFSVQKQRRKPKRGWFLGRVRVIYKQRNRIKFRGDKYDLKPADQPPHTLDHEGEMKPSSDSPPPRISPTERRELVAIGIKARKSQRLIAHELNVTPTTIRRDLEALGITAKKKPTATIRKPGVVFKASSPAIPDNKPLQPAPRRVVPDPLKPKPPKPSGTANPLSPEQLRQQHLDEMIQLVHAWLVAQKGAYSREETVLDKARIRLAASQDHYVGGLHKSPMSAEQLRDDTRPREMESARGTYRTEEICATWLARWLAAWEPKDEKLRYQVIDQTRARVTAEVQLRNPLPVHSPFSPHRRVRRRP